MVVLSGEGPRSTGYNASQGGQFKANITKEFKSGYIHLLALSFLNKNTNVFTNAYVIRGTDANLPLLTCRVLILQQMVYSIHNKVGPTSSDSGNTLEM
jgi:hypothetical protein